MSYYYCTEFAQGSACSNGKYYGSIATQLAIVMSHTAHDQLYLTLAAYLLSTPRVPDSVCVCDMIQLLYSTYMSLVAVSMHVAIIYVITCSTAFLTSCMRLHHIFIYVVPINALYNYTQLYTYNPVCMGSGECTSIKFSICINQHSQPQPCNVF